MFFSKPLKQVTFEDVENFCKEKIKENEVLDYKEAFPSKLEKIIAAFANTFGGLIIVGVPEEDGKPVDNPPGINYTNGLEERVSNIIISNIQPPVFPEIQVCPSKNGKTFVLIQVSQSANTPHAIDNNTLVYLRTGAVTQPERLANLGEQHWLSKNRLQSTNLRNELIGNIQQKYLTLCNLKKANIEFAEINMHIIPEYPSVFHSEIKGIHERIYDFAVNTSGGSLFPTITQGRFNSMKDGTYLFVNNKSDLGELTEFTALDGYGLLFHAQDLGHLNEKTKEEKYKAIYLSQVIESYACLLRFYKKVKAELGIWGDFRVRVALVKMLQVLPVSIQTAMFNIDGPQPYTDRTYIYEGIISSSDLENTELLKKEIVAFAMDLHWAIGKPIAGEVCLAWIDKEIKLD